MKLPASQTSWPRIAVWMCMPLVLMLVLTPVYSLVAIQVARADGIYATPQDGVTQRAYRYYKDVTKIDIQSAGVNAHNGSNPHIWYVIYQVYADSRADGSPLAHNSSHEGGGNFYLHMKDGWVYVPEGYFPEMLGLWMKIFGWAGS